MAKDFTELAAWQLADELRRLILEITAKPTVARDFRYCNQCKDAARSAASNIVEGFGRHKHREFARFLRIAMGSLKEVAPSHQKKGREIGAVDLSPYKCMKPPPPASAFGGSVGKNARLKEE